MSSKLEQDAFTIQVEQKSIKQSLTNKGIDMNGVEFVDYHNQIDSLGDGTSSGSDYNDLINKPSINGEVLTGDKTLEQFGFTPYDDTDIRQLIDGKQPKGDYAYHKDIPQFTSQLDNDANFVTNAVDNLVNYYKKSEIDDLFSAAGGFKIVAVDSIAEVTEEGILYLVPKDSESGIENNSYDEYIFYDGKPEYIGEHAGNVDLSNYYTKQEIDEKNYASLDSIATVAKTGNYSDLNGLPTIPTLLSQLENDTNFINKSVTDLDNYYLKSETYTKTEINEMVSDLTGGGVTIQKVSSIEDVLSPNIIYFVPNSSTPEEKNSYLEYIVIDGVPECIGSTTAGSGGSVDIEALKKVFLTIEDGYTKEEAAVEFTKYVPKEDGKGLSTNDYSNEDKNKLQTNVYTKSEVNDLIPSNISELTNDAGYVTAMEVPDATSDLTNDSGFITSSVDALDNFYTKLETDSAIESQVSEAIAYGGFVTSDTSSLLNYYTSDVIDGMIPQSISDLINDSDFINNKVSNLVNYYDKTYIDQKIGELTKKITELEAVTNPVPVNRGGTNANNKLTAKQNLGISFGTAEPAGGEEGDIYFKIDGGA